MPMSRDLCTADSLILFPKPFLFSNQTYFILFLMLIAPVQQTLIQKCFLSYFSILKSISPMRCPLQSACAYARWVGTVSFTGNLMPRNRFYVIHFNNGTKIVFNWVKCFTRFNRKLERPFFFFFFLVTQLDLVLIPI